VSTPIPDLTLDRFDPIDRGILRIGGRGYHCGAECDQRATAAMARGRPVGRVSGPL